MPLFETSRIFYVGHERGTVKSYMVRMKTADDEWNLKSLRRSYSHSSCSPILGAEGGWASVAPQDRGVRRLRREAFCASGRSHEPGEYD